MNGSTRPPPEQPCGILLVHGGPEASVAWARAGVAPLVVVPQEGGWTAVLPRRAASAASKPYDDAVTLLLNRPVPHRLRAAIGVGVVGRRVVVCVTPAGWRAVRRWLVWQPGSAVVHPGGLPVARLADVVRAAGAASPAAVGALADVLHDPAGQATNVAADVLLALGLPGSAHLAGTDPAAEAAGVVIVEPSVAVVRRFEHVVQDDVSWRDEMEGRH